MVGRRRWGTMEVGDKKTEQLRTVDLEYLRADYTKQVDHRRQGLMV